MDARARLRDVPRNDHSNGANEVDRRRRRVEKQVELYLQLWTARAPTSDKLKAEEAQQRSRVVRGLNHVVAEICRTALSRPERLSLLGRAEGSQAALSTQAAGKRWLRKRKLERRVTLEGRRTAPKKKRTSVWTVSGGLPGLGKSH